MAVATAKRTIAFMGIDQHWERHRLLIPTRIAISVAVMVLAYFLLWPMVQSVFN